MQSQLNRHKDALHHGQMASLYCQELVRNSKILCESYIGELMKKRQETTPVIEEEEENPYEPKDAIEAENPSD